MLFHMMFPMSFHVVAGVHVFSNSAIDEPWQKVIRGRETFEQIVLQHGRETHSSQLISALIGMLSDTTRYCTVLSITTRTLNYSFIAGCLFSVLSDASRYCAVCYY